MIEKKKILSLGVIIFLIGVVVFLFIVMKPKDETIIDDKEIVSIETEKKEEVVNNFYVDIKGSVKKPGVYKVKEGSIVNDLIKMAGGLKKKGTTSNINLSQILKPEMVVYIFSTTELKKETIKTDTVCKTEVIEVNNCVSKEEEQEQTSTSLININTATKDELIKIPGIGESKAVQIIEYRNDRKFVVIEDILNVSGIGESLFAKIKDYITV